MYVFKRVCATTETDTQERTNGERKVSEHENQTRFTTHTNTIITETHKQTHTQDIVDKHDQKFFSFGKFEEQKKTDA